MDWEIPSHPRHPSFAALPAEVAHLRGRWSWRIHWEVLAQPRHRGSPVEEPTGPKGVQQDTARSEISWVKDRESVKGHA